MSDTFTTVHNLDVKTSSSRTLHPFITSTSPTTSVHMSMFERAQNFIVNGGYFINDNGSRRQSLDEGQ